MDIRFFALSDWVESDLILLERIHTSINESDQLTKTLERIPFYRHVDYKWTHSSYVFTMLSTNNRQIPHLAHFWSY